MIFKFLKNNNITIILLKYLFSIYLCAFGLGWIIIHFYFRFLVKRPTFLLEERKPYITERQLLLIFLLALLHFFIIISILWVLYKQYFKLETQFNLFRKLQSIINLLYWKPLEHIHDLIAPHIPYSGTFFIYFSEYINKKSMTLYKLIVILFDFTPRIIISLTFFIEIVIYNQFYYFIYTVIFFIIPLLFNIFLKLFYSFSLRNKPGFEKALIISYTKASYDYKKDKTQIALDYDFRPEYLAYKNTPEGLDIIQTWQRLFIIENDYEYLKTFSNKYALYILLFCSILYASAFTYEIFYFLK